MHQLGLGVSNCASREPTVDTATAARAKSTAAGHHRRSASRNFGKDQAENHDCTHPEMQSSKERLPDCATGSVSPEAAIADAASQDEPCPPEPDVTTKNGKQMRGYQCPFCQQHVNSTIETGQIDHRYACGNKFRVAGGNVTGRIHKHACPTCLPPGKVDRHGTAAPITLLTPN